MSRKVFDIIASAGGVAVVLALVIAGGLLTWGHSFVSRALVGDALRRRVRQGEYGGEGGHAR
jgi:hypothetical protein